MNKPHLAEATRFWKELLTKEECAIDATCGNGYDTATLAELAGSVIAIDIQEVAISSAKQLAKSQSIKWLHQSHETFPAWIEPGSIKLITYNLGYLPGGNKSLTTRVDSTLKSIQNGLPLLKQSGAMTLVCYPGHTEGEKEERELLDFFKTLDRKKYLVSYNAWPNRLKHPSLIKVVKLISSQDDSL